MILSEHVNLFLSNCINKNWAGVFYSAPHHDDFHFILQDLNMIQEVAGDYFLFHPFDHASTPMVRIRSDYFDDAALNQLKGLAINENKGWNAGALHLVESTSFEEYQSQFSQYMDVFSQGKCTKAILSTVVKHEISDVDLGRLMFRLRQAYPQSFIYLLSSPLTGTWVGATPEIFLEFDKDTVSTMSLAGTRKNNNKGSFGGKEMHEQEIVTRYISELFNSKFSNALVEPLSELEYGELVHIISRIQAKVQSGFSMMDFMNFARLYHPTPAVGGYPKESALQIIRDVEKHPRFYYSGFMGLVTREYTQLMVNLRCMAINANYAYIFAGGGLTIQSKVDLEWAETRYKADALRKCLNPS